MKALDVNLATETATVVYNSDACTPRKIRQAIVDLGSADDRAYSVAIGPDGPRFRFRPTELLPVPVYVAFV